MTKYNIYKPCFKFGVVLGLLGITITCSMYIGGAVFFANIKYTILAFLVGLIVYIIFGIKSAKEIRTINGGSITFFKLLLPVFLTFVIGTFISNTFSILLFQLIDPDFSDQVKDMVIVQIESIEDKVSEEKFEQMMSEVQNSSNKGIIDHLKGIVWGLLLYFALAIIITSSIKKTDNK